MEKKTYSVKEVAKILGVSPGIVYKECNEGSLKDRHIRLGSRIVIPCHIIDNMVNVDNNINESCSVAVKGG